MAILGTIEGIVISRLILSNFKMECMLYVAHKRYFVLVTTTLSLI